MCASDWDVSVNDTTFDADLKKIRKTTRKNQIMQSCAKKVMIMIIHVESNRYCKCRPTRLVEGEHIDLVYNCTPKSYYGVKL